MNHNWTYKKLGEVCKTTSGGTPSKDHNEYYEGGTIPWLRSGEVANRNITRTEMFITQEGVDNSSAKLIPQNSVVIAMYGATVGQVGILRIEATTNQAVCSIMPNDSFVPEFLYYALLSHKKAYLELAVGGAQPNISQQIIKNTTIPLPPLETQSRIVAELDLLQSIIDKQKAQLTELDNLAQAVFYDMFGDPVENEMGWEVKKVKDIAERFSDGPFGSNLKSEHYQQEGVRVIRLQNIGVNSFVDIDKAYISEEHYETIKKYSCYPGDIIIGTLGEPNLRASIIPDFIQKAVNKADCVLCRVKKDTVSNIYACAVLNEKGFVAAQCQSYSHGQTRSRISAGQLKEAQMPVPPLSLQQSFAAKIESIEKQKAAISQSIAETQRLFDYTMDKYFG